MLVTTVTADNIFAGVGEKNPDAITIATGQGVLVRGSLMMSLAGADYIIADTAGNPTVADKQSIVILSEDIDATSAAVEAIGFRSGNYDGNYLTFGGSNTAATWKNDARMAGIIINTGAINAIG